MKITPKNSHILITLEERKNETASGIILPGDEKVEYQFGIVENAGDTDIVKKGNKVIFPDFAPIEIRTADRSKDSLYFIKEEDVVAVYE